MQYRTIPVLYVRVMEESCRNLRLDFVILPGCRNNSGRFTGETELPNCTSRPTAVGPGTVWP